MSGAELAAILTAIGGLLSGIYGAIKAFGSQKIAGVAVVVDAYTKIVDDLQKEVDRLQDRITRLENENASLRKRVQDLENSNADAV